MTDASAFVNLTDTTYRIVLDKAPLPVLVAVTGEFCGPSRALESYLDQAVEDYGDQIMIAKGNVEDCPTMGREFAIKGTPTYIWVEAGIPIASRIGTMTYDQFADWIEETLGRKR